MNRKYLSAKLPTVVAASALVLLLISCDNQGTGKEKEIGKDSVTAMSPLCKSVSATDLQNRFKSNGSDRTMVSIYPIKKSSDMSKKDFDLVIIMHDGKNAAATPPDDVKKFEKETGYYVEYMKKNNAGMKDIPSLYYATVRRTDARAVQGLQVCIDLSKTLASYDFTGSTVGGSSFRLDSAGKCPPECPTPPEPPE